MNKKTILRIIKTSEWVAEVKWKMFKAFINFPKLTERNIKSKLSNFFSSRAESQDIELETNKKAFNFYEF